MLHTFESVFQTVLHHDKELLQRGVVRVQCTAQVKSWLNQALDAQLGHVHQVKPLNSDGVLGIWGHMKKHFIKHYCQIKQAQAHGLKKNSQKAQLRSFDQSA